MTSCRVLVEHDVGEAQDVAGAGAAGAAQDRLRARDDLREAERLGDVVVPASGQRLDLVLGRVLRGQEEHGGLEALGAQPAADLEPSMSGSIKSSTIRSGSWRRRRRAPRGRCRLVDLVALVAERRRRRRRSTARRRRRGSRAGRLSRSRREYRGAPWEHPESLLAALCARAQASTPEAFGKCGDLAGIPLIALPLDGVDPARLGGRRGIARYSTKP